MTESDILIKAIEKAIENGMSPGVIDKGTFYQNYMMVKGRGPAQLVRGEFNAEDCYGLVFSHPFAKAFWKWENMGKRESGAVDKGEQEAWKDHLQQMVLEENPIQYLKKFL